MGADTGKGFQMITERTVFVTESEYKAIQQWEDDGGALIDIVYVIMPDDDIEHTPGVVQSPPMTKVSRSPLPSNRNKLMSGDQRASATS